MIFSRPDEFKFPIFFLPPFIQIHMTKMHKDAVGFECSVCHTSLPNKRLLEVQLSY